MIKLSIKTNFAQVAKELDALRSDIADRAAISAVNKVVAQAQTQMSREITSEFNIKAAKVKESLRVRKARMVRGQAIIEAVLESPSKRGRSLNLINFSARQTKAGVTVSIKRGGGRKLIRSAFIANQGRTVFARVGKSRLPIKALQTIEVAQMFNTKRINSRVVRFIEDKLPSLMQNEIRFFTERFNRA